MVLTLGFPLLLLLSVIPSLIVGGCGLAPPAGGGITISGLIVDATNTSTGLEGAYVYVPHRPVPAGAFSTRQADLVASDTSEADGSYELRNVPSGDIQIIVDPPANSRYTGVQLDITVSGTANIRLDITLVPADVANEIAAVVVSPSSATVTPGGTQPFSATVIKGNGDVVPVSPTWVVTGNIGTIDADGLFTAGQQVGSGLVVAVVAGQIGSAQVSVTVSTESPILFVFPTTLNFGTAESQLSFAIQNLGQGTLTWSISGVPAWASVDPASGTNEAMVTMTIDRVALGAALGSGGFRMPLSVASNGGDVTMTLNVTSTLLEVIAQ